MSTRLSSKATESAALRRRIREFYRQLNRHDWGGCFEFIDPELRRAGRVQAEAHKASLLKFMDRYQKVDVWYVRVSLHLREKENKRDMRPFAYTYVLWQDAQGGLHLFRERWIRESGDWHTRVVGLVAYDKAQSA